MAQTLVCGTPVAGEINPGSEQDQYYFTGATGDRIWVSLVTTGGEWDFHAVADLFDPTGVVRGTVGSAAGEFTLAQSGTYTLRVRDNTNDATGTYVLEVDWAWPLAKQCTVASIACGVPTSGGAINPGSEQDLYHFTGAAGDRIWVSLVTTGGEWNFHAVADLFDPAGVVRGTVGSAAGEFTLAQSGTYTLRVRDNTNDASGTYTLEWELVGRPCPCDGTTLTLDGGSSSTRAQGGTFVFTGSGFAPGTPVRRFATGPSGTQELLPLLSSNGEGNIDWAYTATW